MTTVPDEPRLYHITHVENLPRIIEAGGLWSDAEMVARGGPVAPIGMDSIKQRRLGLPVGCHPGDKVGQYVPFYFCPRSIMLFLLYRGNHPEVHYRDGQEPIVHLEAHLREVVAWAEAQGIRWAFTLSNAGSNYAEFRKDLGQLHEVDWDAVADNDFRDASVKEGKQAEFLLHSFLPWSLVRCIGVSHTAMQAKVVGALVGGSQRPDVQVRREWYF